MDTRSRPENSKPIRLTPAQKKFFREQGYLHLPRVVPRPRVDAALRVVNAALVGDGCAELCPGDPEPVGMSKAIGALRDAPEINALLRESPLAATAESLLGEIDWQANPRGWLVLRFPQLKRLEQEPRYHIDGVYTADHTSLSDIRIRQGTVSTNSMKVTVYLNDVPREDSGNFALYPGSHLLMARHLREKGWETLLDGMPKLDYGRPPVQIRGRAGDAILCHYLLVHDGVQNLSPHIRYAVFFDLAEKEHNARWKESLVDPWLEWPGLAPKRAGSRA